MTRYFLTLDWCNQGKRGVFCDAEGNPFRKDDSPHTYEEMWDILDAFFLVLSPQSLPLTEDELKQYNQWLPLEEYSGVYGYAYKKEPK